MREVSVIRRTIFGVFGVGFLVTGVQEFRRGAQMGLAAGLSLVGIFLIVTALTGKGG